MPVVKSHLTLAFPSTAICEHVLQGDVLKAIELTNKVAEHVLTNNSDVYFELLALHFIGLVSSKDR